MHTMKMHLTVLVLALLYATQTALSENCPVRNLLVNFPNIPPVLTKAFNDFEQLLKSQLNSTSRPGIAYFITYRGKLMLEGGMGVLSKETKNSPSSYTIFRLGRVTKVFVAIMAYQMFERGFIKSLDDPFQNYSPDFEIQNPFGSSKITIRQMLSQLSGLQREAPCNYGSLTSVCESTTAEIYSYLKNESLIFPPYMVPSYSNLGFALLGNGLAAFMNTTFENYVQKNILEPLKMGETGFNFTSSVVDSMATGYGPSGSKVNLINLNWLSPAGQMYSSPRAIARLAALFASGFDVNITNDTSLPDSYAQVLKPETVRQMSLPVYVNPDGTTMFGTPWEMRYQNNYTVCNKGGLVPGYSTLFSFVSQLGLGVSVFWSGSIDEFEASSDIYDILLPAFTTALEDNLPAHVDYPKNAPMYEGSYKATSKLGPLTAKIAVIQEFQRITISITEAVNAYLLFVSPTTAKLFVLSSQEPCMTTEMNAFQFEFVYFTLDASGSKVLSFIVPGIGFYTTSFVHTGS